MVRLDVNVPLQAKKVLDDSRLVAALPTLRWLLNKGAHLILVGHLGRPKPGKITPELSLKPIGYALGRLLRQPVKVLALTQGTQVIRRAAVSGPVLLENIRFIKGEEDNSLELGRKLGELGDIFVNEAFSVCHRAAASLVAITKYLPSYAGFYLAEEVRALEQIRQQGKPPVVAVIGGAKVADKLPVIAKLVKRCSAVLTGGEVANTFLFARRQPIGKSLYDQTELASARRLLKRFAKKIILPSDVIICRTSLKTKQAQWKQIKEITKQDIIVDIGPNTVGCYAAWLKLAKTIFWGGPLGLIEEPKWSHGSKSLAWLMHSQAKGKSYVLAGGGETAAFLHKYKFTLDHISTAGGALLEFLSGAVLPGLEALGYNPSLRKLKK